MSVGSRPSFAVAVNVEHEEHAPQYWDLSFIPCQALKPAPFPR